MNLYYANDFVANLPDGLKDQTINVFALTDEGPSEVAVVVSRDRLRRGEDLDQFIDRQHAAILKQMPLFRLLRREDFVLDKQPARLTECIWHPPEGAMFQRQIVVFSKATGRVLLLSVTCRESLSSKAEALFTEFVGNFRLRT